MTTEISTQIDTIAEQTEELKQLKKQAEKIEEQEEIAERKNKAFAKVQSTIRSQNRDAESLRKWMEFTRAITDDIDLELIHADTRSFRDTVSKFVESEYDDYDDSSEIYDLNSEIESGTDFDTHISRLQSEVADECEMWIDEIERTKTVLQIPDVGEPGDIDQLNEIREFISTIEKGTFPRNTSDPAGQWEQFESAYESIDISWDEVQRRYELSDRSLEMVKKLVRGDTVLVADIDMDILADLQRIEAFSQDLTIEFQQ